MAKAKPYMGVYEHLDFPPYQYHEYPKWVKKRDGSSVIVNSKSEELKMIDELIEEEQAVQQNDVIQSQAKTIADLEKQLAELKTGKDQAQPAVVKPPITK